MALPCDHPAFFDDDHCSFGPITVHLARSLFIWPALTPGRRPTPLMAAIRCSRPGWSNPFQ